MYASWLLLLLLLLLFPTSLPLLLFAPAAGVRGVPLPPASPLLELAAAWLLLI
jgi:hypothetical protein